MSSMTELLAECVALDIQLLPTGDGGLTIESSRDDLTPDLVRRLREHKTEILAIQRDVVVSDSNNDEDLEVVDIDWFKHIDDRDRRQLLGPREYPNPCRYCGCRSRHWSRCPTRFDDELTTVAQGQFRGRRLDDCPTSFLHQLVRAGWMWASPELQNEARRILYLRINYLTDRQLSDIMT